MSKQSQNDEKGTALTTTIWRTPAQVAERFQISIATVHAKIHSGEWPHHRLGVRAVRFSDANLEEIELMSRRVAASKPLRDQIAALEQSIAAMSILGAASRNLKSKKSKLLGLRIRLVAESGMPSEP